MNVLVEHCSSINIGHLQKKIRKIIDRDFPDSSVDEIYNHTIEELKNFTVNDQYFEYTAIPNRFGGYRWFFLCPKCKKRSNKLFLPPEGSGLVKKYLCKECHGLKNQSVVMSQDRMYKKVLKPLKKMKQIEKRLNKGYLPENKITELLNEYDVLKSELKSTPEYRLYMFRKEQEALK